MKKHKNVAVCILSVFLMAAVWTVIDVVQAKEDVKPSSIQVKNVQKKLQIKKGERFKLSLNVKVSPNKKTYKKVSFATSDNNIVSVSSR